MIQGFNQEGQRAIGAIRLGITIEDMQSSAWLHVINAKTSYNVLLGRPWMHENRLVPSTYHQCLKYYKGEVEKTVVADDEPFTEAESHFADAKFYLKNRVMKELKADDGMKNKNKEPSTKREEVTIGEAKAVSKEVQPNVSKSYRGNITSYGKKVSSALQYVPKRKKDEGEPSNRQANILKELTLLVKRIEAVKSSSMLFVGFVAQNHIQNVALPIKRTDKGFDPNTYKLFAKAGYNPNEPSKLGKLPSEAATRQPREGLGYKQLSPVRISIRRASNNYITVEDESTASNKPSVFDRLGKSPVKTSVFERLGPLKKGNKFRRNSQSIRTPVSPKIHEISKDFQSLVPSRMRRQTKLVVSCKEVLKVKPYTVVYTKECDEDEESVGSSYHVIVQVENGIPSSMEDNAELEDVSPCYHISFSDGDPQEDEDVKDAPPELEERVKTTVDALKKVNLGTDEEPRPTYLKLMIDATTGYEEMSFMDGSSGYNQIRMAPKDEELTAFHTRKGIYCYKVMPFGLKNAGATYQRAMQNIFDDLFHKNVECYVDDLVVKSREKGDHMKDLRMLKHYFQAHVVRLISKANPIKFVMSKPVLSDQLARWYLQFQQLEILYIPQKAVKGQTLANFLVDHPIPDDWELTDELPDGDAMVVEVQPPWKMKENKKTDALAALASSLALPDQAQVTVCQKWVVPPPNEVEGEDNELKHLVVVSEVEKEEWRQPIIDYL
ncbi:uncharacterized protein [Nicotiana sylvestris]|uniref:uncharacterized protein n=1 Tax=Nicotiana sylvestris TaxID=4096 RepID=UPI00388CD7C7